MMRNRLRANLAIGLLTIATSAVLPSCSGIEKAERPTKAIPVSSTPISVPQMMRGTIAADARIVGYQERIVRGYGLVVGLNGTGSRELPPPLRAHMLATMAQHGIGSYQMGGGDLNAEQMLNSLDTAVVVVEAVIPPGSTIGTEIDVRVYADPRTGTTSLEGGTLYTTELRPVTGPGLPPTGSRQAFHVAEAGGPVLINPFADPDAVNLDTVSRTGGRVLNGGRVVRNIPMKLQLSTPSYNRVRVLMDAVNTVFPREPKQLDETAHGESDETIKITVPPSYRDRPQEFVELLMHTSIYQAGAEATAMSTKRLLLANPGSAQDASWRWEALGKRVIPVIQDLYDFSEELPRMAALRAGARLNDALVVPPLIEMANSASLDTRLRAIRLLEDAGFNPRIDLALREMLDDDAVDVRLAAYEALITRNDPLMRHYDVNGRFMLDIIPSRIPMIYVTQTGEPRIAVFGTGLEIPRPILAEAWSGRFMIRGQADNPNLEVYYRAADAPQGLIQLVGPKLDEFIVFLGHRASADEPKPGLDMSYGQVVGILHRLWRDKHLAVDFKAEQDRVLAAILRREKDVAITERPEFGDERSDPDFDFLDPNAGGPPSGDLGSIEMPPLPSR